jgi:glycosyltransferase involved in cell wall biosynthesis
MTRVSVIVPAYQAAALLDTSLASVAAQTRPADEVVVVDDGSSDATAEVASRWAAVLPLVLVRQPVNGGLGAARCDGIARSSGDLVALLDADDVWLPDHLDVLLDTYEQHRRIVLARTYRWFPGRRLAPAPAARSWSLPAPARQPTVILDRNFVTCFVLFSRASYDAAGGFRPLRLDEDWDLWIRMIRGGERVHLAPTVTALRRFHGASLSAAEACLDHDIALLRELRPCLAHREQRVVDRAIRRRVARQRLVEGYAAARRGNRGAARAAWWRAAWLDRSLRAPLADGAGSVTLRALACLALPGRVVQTRDRRAGAEGRPPALRLVR